MGREGWLYQPGCTGGVVPLQCCMMGGSGWQLTSLGQSGQGAMVGAYRGRACI